MASNTLRRTQSNLDQLAMDTASESSRTHRRGSHDDFSTASAVTYMVNTQATLETLMQREDTDGDEQITVDDSGFKVLRLKTRSSNGFRFFDLRGTYMLSNLLQDLVQKLEGNQKWTMIPHASLAEDPVTRLRRLIKNFFWGNLTRTLDATSIRIAAPDPKDRTTRPQPRIYIPQGAFVQLAYYEKIAREDLELNLDVQLLPSTITDDVYRDIIKKPGLLALEMEEVVDQETGQKELRGLPFIVPGGCFNELYNWDSYFIALGLLADEKIELVRDLVSNFIFEIQHYGLIPNANRSYYLLRSQPPFLTDLALRVLERLPPQSGPETENFIQRAAFAAIKEHYKVWLGAPRLDKETGLSRYRPAGVASPPECALSHFAEVLRPYAQKYGMGDDIEKFRNQYDNGEIHEPELDNYFLHDRGVRESGHDLSLRVENVCADLATIDLNCLLYKYERDISYIIRTFFNGSMKVPDEFFVIGMQRTQTASHWDSLANARKKAIDEYLWNDEMGTYLDYNTTRREQTKFETVTCLWALWCGVASPYQAARLVASLPRFERVGGLLSTNIDRRGSYRCHDSHQWDYPYGWAPHQIMAWEGLRKYGYIEDAERLAYRWLYLVTKIFTEFNGTVVEKYDVTQLLNPHQIDIDYGNQGLGFKGYAKEGFGWTNASYVYGMDFLSSRAKRALGMLASWEVYSNTERM